jgi:hypothetical protein
MWVWIVYLEDESGFIGAFDVEDDAYEFQRTYAADSGRVVYLAPVTLPYRAGDDTVWATLHDGPAEDN